MNVWFATNNSHKKRELEAVLNLKLKIPCEEGLNFSPEETGSSFFENALIKARELKKLLNDKNDPVIADDSGLCVHSLGGRPGINSAYYGDTKDRKLSSSEKNILLLDELKDNPDRSAYFVCTLILLFDYDRFYSVQETFEGEIVKSPEDAAGDGGFGYDPVFLLPQSGLTLAQLSEDEKNSISHRGKAGRFIAKILKN